MLSFQRYEIFINFFINFIYFINKFISLSVLFAAQRTCIQLQPNEENEEQFEEESNDTNLFIVKTPLYDPGTPVFHSLQLQSSATCKWHHPYGTEPQLEASNRCHVSNAEASNEPSPDSQSSYEEHNSTGPESQLEVSDQLRLQTEVTDLQHVLNANTSHVSSPISQCSPVSEEYQESGPGSQLGKSDLLPNYLRHVLNKRRRQPPKDFVRLLVQNQPNRNIRITIGNLDGYLSSFSKSI